MVSSKGATSVLNASVSMRIVSLVEVAVKEPEVVLH